MATLVQSGLPPGADILLQDNLRKVLVAGRPRPPIARTAKVPASGTLVLDGLPDSNYGIFFARPAYAKYAIPSLDVGDRTAFRRAGRRLVPPPVVFVTAGIAGNVLQLIWRLRVGGWNADRYVVEASTNGGSVWFIAAEIADPNARNVYLDTLTTGTTYLLRIKAFNADGRCMGPSNSMSATIGHDPAIPASLDSLQDGTTYARIKRIALDGNGRLDLSSTGVVNRGALALVDSVTAGNIAKDAVTANAILDGAVTQTKIGVSAVGANQLASGAVTSIKIGTGAVGSTQLANSAAGLTKVSGGILTGSGNEVTLPSGKTLNAVAGAVKLKTFASMPTVSQVADGEWFAVSGGSFKGMYVRSGAVAFNGAGTESSFGS